MTVPGSESPRIFRYAGCVGLLVFSLMMTSFGRANNAWIVLSRPSEMDKFQRGVRGLDCYETIDYHEHRLTCLPWAANYSIRVNTFAELRPLHASLYVHMAYFIAILIMISQVVSLAFTIGHCCSWRFSESADEFRVYTVFVVSVTVGLWIVLFAMYVYEAFSDTILPARLMKPGWSCEIGSGCWMFFVGGMFPYIGAIVCLFGSEIHDTLREVSRNRRLPVPTNNQV